MTNLDDEIASILGVTEMQRRAGKFDDHKKQIQHDLIKTRIVKEIIAELEFLLGSVGTRRAVLERLKHYKEFSMSSDTAKPSKQGGLIWLDCGVCGEERFMGIPRNIEVDSVTVACSICQIQRAIERGEELIV